MLYNGAFNFVNQSDADTQYEYDSNGNLTKDLNKNIIGKTYNYLNLPESIQVGDKSYMSYSYNAVGNKLGSNFISEIRFQFGDYVWIGKNTHTTDYCGSFIYNSYHDYTQETASKPYDLKYILIPDGYITIENNMPTYHYYIKDYQGNNRIVALQNGTIEETNHYYPYGAIFGETAGKIGNKAERLASLNSSIGTMGTLEGSTKVYSLSHTGDGENGGVTLNTSTNIVDIKFGGTANFVHEMTHAGQFETGDVAFSNTGISILQDVYDETAAYKAQFGYSPSSVSGLTSTSVANSFGAITPAWVQGLRDATGSMPYAVGGSANTGLIPININSTRDALIQAYPWNAAAFRGLYNIRTLQGIYYKR